MDGGARRATSVAPGFGFNPIAMNLNSRGERVAAVNEAHMNESIVEMQRLLRKWSAICRQTRRRTNERLVQVGTAGSLASTLVLMLKGQGRARSSPTAGSVRNPMRSARTSLCDGRSTLSAQP